GRCGEASRTVARGARGRAARLPRSGRDRPRSAARAGLRSARWRHGRSSARAGGRFASRSAARTGREAASERRSPCATAAARAGTLASVGEAGMRTTWDAAAASEQVELYVGDRARGREELAGFLGRLGADPRGGVCVELGCGFGRMTDALAERFDRVLALDVSPAMLDQARKAVQASNVEFRLVSGAQLDSLDDGIADAVVCYLVLQH